ncbi:GP46-like surface antigen, putative, partial [Bodo saltans]
MEFNSGSKTRDRLSGTLPDTFRNAPSMQSFLFCFQFVNGTVSDEMIASWPNIQEVRLINNSLSGTIPPSLTTRVSLELLELQSNYFTGTIPRFNAPLVNLTLINIEHNKGLSGSFPDSIVINPALQMVALNNIGQLQGT